MLHSVVSIVAIFLAVESRAFLAIPTRSAVSQRAHVVDRQVGLTLHMGKGKANLKKQKQQQKQRLDVVARKRERGESLPAGDAEEREAIEVHGDVPRLVVMDLDYTLW